ncbi:MAG TPA: DUF499 domain-containing protein [Anaerolineae bacterium]|nr:DUF499 domain-containing protein [Anaerolineae bacterium]
MALKPWYKVVTPRADLREGKPLDASEFAVHLEQVRDGRAPDDYQKPERFFDRTYLTQNLTGLAAEVMRRLAGIKTETSAVFNMATAFGGGKTHALTLLYHLAQHGPKADRWTGVGKLLDKAGVKSVPHADAAVFVGTEFDSLTGRGGDDGTPLRKTPWGEIAFQLGGADGFAVVAEHDRQMIAPADDVIRRLFRKDRPCLLLLDELMNYVSRYRKLGMATQLYDFLQNLSETVRGEDNVVLCVSIPSSIELEMSAEDQADYERLRRMLDRLGKAVIIAAEAETSEIIRRRLFEWDSPAVTQDGRILLPHDALATCNEYADWINTHRQQVPTWFPIDNAREAFAATFPFHPTLLSVFERKWQAILRFQRTRGILRLLALWASRAYQDGFKGAHADPLIGVGTAPLDDAMFRAAVFEQLGEDRLEGEAVETIRKAATAIFFESNGGMLREYATVPEVRLAVAEPDLDIGNVETVLEALGTTCYYLSVERTYYRFSLSPNLNKLLADRRANIQPDTIEERMRAEIQRVFASSSSVQPLYFPERSGQIPDRPAFTLIVLAPENSLRDRKTLPLVETMTRDHGTSSRTFKSALVWAIAEDDAPLKEEARKALAWEASRDEDSDRLDEAQKQQLAENIKKAERDLRESVWRTYKNIAMLGKDNALRTVDLGLIHSSSITGGIIALILQRLRQDGDVEDNISPNFLVRNWPPAFKEWSTKSVREAFFASPQFPRLLNPDVVKETLARGVQNGYLAYVGKKASGEYAPFIYNAPMNTGDVEISDDVSIITRETAEAYKKTQESPTPQVETPIVNDGRTEYIAGSGSQSSEAATANIIEVPAPGKKGGTQATQLMWTGDVPPQKWMNFYTAVGYHPREDATGCGLRRPLRANIVGSTCAAKTRPRLTVARVRSGAWFSPPPRAPGRPGRWFLTTSHVPRGLSASASAQSGGHSA